MSGYRAALLVASLACTGTASAEPVDLLRVEPGYTIFNKPGATMADHDAALEACVRPLQSFFDSNPPAPEVSARIAEDFAAIFGIGHPSAVLDNCMVVQGWRVVAISEAQGDILNRMNGSALTDAIAPLVSADPPPGEIVRMWRNEAAIGDTVRIADSKLQKLPKRLSVRAASLRKPTPEPPAPAVERGRVKQRQSWAGKAVRPVDLASVPSGAGVILIKVDGLNFLHERGLILARMGAAPNGRALDDGMTRILAVKLGFGSSTGMTAYYVPPGRWRLDKITAASNGALSLCLGAPAFEVGAGEVVFAGAFDFKAAEVGPDLDLAPVRAWLDGAAEPSGLKAAAYVNGVTFPCTGGLVEGEVKGIYAYEVKGAPYEPGYTWGGAARPSPPLAH